MIKETDKQPEALRLAEMLDEEALISGLSRREHLDYRADAAVELREQHALIAELVGRLSDVLDVFVKPHNKTLCEVVDARATLAKAKEYQS